MVLTQTYPSWSQNGQEINYLLKPSGGRLGFLSLVVCHITVNSEHWNTLQTQGMPLLTCTLLTLIQSSQATKRKGTFYRLLAKEASVDPCLQLFPSLKKKKTTQLCLPLAVKTLLSPRLGWSSGFWLAFQHILGSTQHDPGAPGLPQQPHFKFFQLVLSQTGTSSPCGAASLHEGLSVPLQRGVNSKQWAALGSPRSPTRHSGSARIQRQTFYPQDLSSFLSRDHASTLLPPTGAGTATLALGGLGTKTRHCVPLPWQASEADSGLSGPSWSVTPQGSLPLSHVLTPRGVPHIAGAEWINEYMN